MRVGTFAQQNHVTNSVLDVRATVQDFQRQISTGKVGERFSDIPRDAAKLTNFKAEIAQTQQFIDNANTARLRLQTADLVINNLHGIARDVRSHIKNLDTLQGASDTNLPNLARGFLDQVISLLNTSIEDRFLFSGIATNKQPIIETTNSATALGITTASTIRRPNATDLPGLGGATAPNTWVEYYLRGTESTTGENSNQAQANRLGTAVGTTQPQLSNFGLAYYDGGDVFDSNGQVLPALRARVDDSLAIPYGFAADELGFSDLIRSLHMLSVIPANATQIANIVDADGNGSFVAGTDSEPLYFQILQDVGNVLDRTLANIELVQSRLAVSVTQIDSVIDVQTQTKVLQENLISEIEDIDQTEAITKLQTAANQLEASFSTISRVNSLTLVNFL